MTAERDAGRAAAARLRAEAGIETPCDNPLVLRRLAAIVRPDAPSLARTAPRRRNTARVKELRGASRRDPMKAATP